MDGPCRPRPALVGAGHRPRLGHRGASAGGDGAAGRHLPRHHRQRRGRVPDRGAALAGEPEGESHRLRLAGQPPHRPAGTGRPRPDAGTLPPRTPGGDPRGPGGAHHGPGDPQQAGLAAPAGRLPRPRLHPPGPGERRRHRLHRRDRLGDLLGPRPRPARGGQVPAHDAQPGAWGRVRLHPRGVRQFPRRRYPHARTEPDRPDPPGSPGALPVPPGGPALPGRPGGLRYLRRAEEPAGHRLRRPGLGPRRGLRPPGGGAGAEPRGRGLGRSPARGGTPGPHLAPAVPRLRGGLAAGGLPVLAGGGDRHRGAALPRGPVHLPDAARRLRGQRRPARLALRRGAGAARRLRGRGPGQHLRRAGGQGAPLRPRAGGLRRHRHLPAPGDGPSGPPAFSPAC